MTAAAVAQLPSQGPAGSAAELLADIGGVLVDEASGGLARAGGAREQLHPAAAGREHHGDAPASVPPPITEIGRSSTSRGRT